MPFGLSYFLPPIPLFPNTFTHLPSLENRVTLHATPPQISISLSRPLALFLAHKTIFLLHFSLLISYLFLTYFLVFLSFLPYSSSGFLFLSLFSFSTLSSNKAEKIPYFWRNFELPTSRLSVNFPYGILSTKNDATRRCHFFLLPAKHFEIFLRW